MVYGGFYNLASSIAPNHLPHKEIQLPSFEDFLESRHKFGFGSSRNDLRIKSGVYTKISFKGCD